MMKLLGIIMLSIVSASNRILSYNHLVNQLGVPSLYYSLFTSKEDLMSFSAGFAELKSKKGVDDQTEYALFSITKTFTATAILQLKGQGLLS
ncbi:MAG: beta-lactamase family protein, partial [Cyclobacteriaceae bacterium]|nr:beta-lactamase family protein [Cyclobacteriaceae bacterium]